MEGQEFLHRSHRFSRPLHLETRLERESKDAEARAAREEAASKRAAAEAGSAKEVAVFHADVIEKNSAKHKLYERLRKESEAEEARIKLEYDRAQAIDPLEQRRRDREKEKERTAAIWAKRRAKVLVRVPVLLRTTTAYRGRARG